MEPTFFPPPTNQPQGNSYRNFQNGVPNQQGSTGPDPVLSNEFSNIDLNSSGSSGYGGPPINMAPQTVDPYKFPSNAPPMSLLNNTKYSNSNSTQKQPSNAFSSATSVPNSILSNASAPSPLPSNILVNHQLNNTSANSNLNQGQLSGKTTPNMGSFGIPPSLNAGPSNHFSQSSLGSQNQNQQQSKPMSLGHPGDLQQTRKSTSPQKLDGTYGNGLNSSDPSPVSETSTPPTLSRPPQSYTPRQDVQRPDGGSVPSNLSSPDMSSISAFKPSSGGPFQPLKPQPAFPSQPRKSPTDYDTPQGNPVPTSFQPSKGATQDFSFSPQSTPSQPQQLQQGYRGPNEAHNSPTANPLRESAGSVHSAGSGDATYNSQASGPRSNYHEPPSSINSPSMSYPASGVSQTPTSSGVSSSGVGVIQSPEQPPRQQQQQFQPQSPQGMNGYPSSPPSGLRGTPSGVEGSSVNGPPSGFAGPQHRPPTSLKGPSSFGNPSMNGPPTAFGGQPSNLGGPPMSGAPSNLGGFSMGGAQSNSGGPPMSALPSNLGGPPISGAQSNLGGPPMSAAPSNFGGPPMSRPPSNLGGLPPGLAGPPVSSPSLNGPGTGGHSSRPNLGRPQYARPSPQTSSGQQQGFPPQPSQQTGGFPPQPSQQQDGFPPQPLQQQHGGFPQPSQQQGGFPPQPSQQQRGSFPPQPSQQLGGFPPQPSQQPGGFPPQPSQQPGGFPPQPSQQPGGFPPQPSQQQRGSFPPLPSQQPGGFPPQPSQQQGSFPPQQQGFPPQSSQQPGFPPTQNAGFPPSQQQSGAFPPMSQGAGPAGFPQQKYPPLQGRPGYPPQAQPGYPQGPESYDQQHQQPQEYSGMQYPNTRPQPPPQKKLDPDNMPSRIQVMDDDRKTRAGEFRTDQRGGLPPLVTTPFTVQDQGNCSPRFVRATMYSVPVTSDLMKQVNVPLGLVVSPLARVTEGEIEPPEADFSQCGGPVRCGRCKAYMAPFMQFVDGGRRFHCPMCKATTDVPENYFAHMDALGQRMDKFQRPELCLGSYELIVSEQYCRDSKFPNPPALVFLLDVSYNNVKSGLVSLLCSRMMDILSEVTNERLRVGFITYASSVQFYNIKSSLMKPELLEVTDVHDMFMPLRDGFLGTAEEAGAAIVALMGQIPVLFQDTKQTETLLLPAIQAGLEALKANDATGKLLVFNSSLPIFDAPGKLANRDDRKMLGTDKEKTVLIPQNTQYNSLAQECVNSGVSVDLFVFNNAYVDLATIGQVARLTGGQIYKYTYFQAEVDGDRLVEDVRRNVTRQTAYDAVMRVRTSTGIRPTDFFGHMFMSNTTDMEFASMDCEKAIALELKHDDKLVPEEGVIIQVAFLYTSAYGVRKVRVHNLSLNCTPQMADIYRYCELDTLMNFLCKQCATKLCDTTPRALREALVTKTASILATYRKHCASPGSSLGQLILPECLKLLPLYVNSLLRCDALSGGPEISLDDRSFALYSATVMDIPSSVVYLYPHLISLHNIDPDSDELPTQERCSFEKLQPDGAYLLDNSIYMFLWLGQNISNQWVESVFGVPCPAHIDTDRPHLPELNNALNRRVHDIIDYVRSTRPRSMRLTVVRQKDKLEMVLRQFLIEDRGYTEAQMSYVDFLCHIHKEIRNLLS